MSGVWDRDEAGAFIEELFAKHNGEIYAYLFRMMRDSELAADMTQDAFVKAYKNYDTLEKPENARAWLYQIAHRVALDEIRRRKIVRFLPWTGESRGSAPSAEHLVMDARLSGDLQRALAKIPERQRAALLLAELHDMTGSSLPLPLASATLLRGHSSRAHADPCGRRSLRNGKPMRPPRLPATTDTTAAGPLRSTDEPSCPVAPPTGPLARPARASTFTDRRTSRRPARARGVGLARRAPGRLSGVHGGRRRIRRRSTGAAIAP
jgi:RNA polymerase sigma-70 factor (ECF subfamily)